jgi:drug/metabolite transporter (DMT)-like permease
MWIVYALLASLLWGVDYTLAERVLSRKVSPLCLNSFQMLGGAILFVTAFLSRGGAREEIQRAAGDRRLFGLILLTVITGALGNFCIVTSIGSKNATISSLIEVSYPLSVVLFTWLIFHKINLNLGTTLGGAFIILGVVLIYCLG